MKAFLFIAAATIALGFAAPASAQVYLGTGPGGVGVQVGPDNGYYGNGHYRGERRHYGYRGERQYEGGYAYASDCRLVRSRVVTQSGRVIVRTRRICG